ADYHDPEKRSIANAVTIEFNDGSKSDEIVVEYPVGHKRRRAEGLPLLVEKYKRNLRRIFDDSQVSKIEEATLNFEHILTMNADDFISLYVKN
ncbi:MAG: 2-methylcitrate dehydratase, partial [Actinomycetota bacterium]